MAKTDSSAIYNILAFRFAGQKGASDAVSEIKASGALDGHKIVAQAVVEQDAAGKVHVHEPGRGGVGAVVGIAAGGLLSLIGGPVGLLAWAAAGGVVGGVAGKYLGRPISKGDLEQIGQALTPDSSMMMLLLEDTESEGVINSLQGYSADVVTLTVGDELSGQIASYVAGGAQDPEGNVVAGEGGVAADAEGNVAAEGTVVAASPE
ncbi:MAG: DUF1269 domain-containing protein [Anaerolineales bacterium]|nr:DUF1269 domain-containing protein [Anaerolineae bacterium]MCB9133713.1 DUF1269 domain-containing protein [Anaerolineales bacterium]